MPTPHHRPWLALCGLVLALGCTHLPPNRPGTTAELRAVGAARQAWQAAGRGAPACPAVDRLRIAVTHSAQEWCCPQSGCPYREACYFVAPPTMFDDNAFYLIVDAGYTSPLYTLVVHEVLHQLRACWVQEAAGTPDYEVRAQWGADAPIRYLPDHDHNDVPLWQRKSGAQSIEAAAWELYAQ